MACAVLAADPSLRGGSDGASTQLDTETEQRRTQLANTCRLLEKAGERSPVALGMVKRLVGVLKKHRIHGVAEDEIITATTQVTKGSVVTAGALLGSGEPSATLQNIPHQQNVASFPLMRGLAQPQLQFDNQNWAYAPLEPNTLTGIWNDFLGTDPTNNGWEQLFAELDYLSGM